MNAIVSQLFSELADLPAEERDRVCEQRRIPADVRAELQSLLAYDSNEGTITSCVQGALDHAVRSTLGLSHCGAYRLVRMIGSGGMGDVYLATRDDGEVHQQVAVKLMRAGANRSAWHERFLKERQFLASLSHPSIARLMDAGHTAAGHPYLVMEFVDGVPVDKYASALDLRKQLELFMRVCEGVSHAHSHSIIHRDLKPSNILVDSSGTPKILDFGIAKSLGTTDQTRTVERLLTPDYASPEQLRGAPQTIATDIYSLGAVLYKLVTGQCPREGRPEKQIVAPSRLNPALPRDFDFVVLKALRSEPAERYASVEALVDDVRSILDSRPVQARSGDTSYRVRKFLLRNRASVAGAALTFGSLLLAAAIASHYQGAAEDRLWKGRHLASTVLSQDEAAGSFYDSSRTRYERVTLSKDYLEELSAKGRNDRTLALELGRAYSVLARAQGITIAAPVGQRGNAGDSLRRAGTLVERVLAADPQNREALLTAARVSHDRMIFAEAEHRNPEALAHAGIAVARIDRLLRLEGLSAAESEIASDYLYQVAVTYKNLHRFDEGIQYSRRSLEIARSLPDGALREGLGLSILADLYRRTGDLERALKTITEARACLARARFNSETAKRSSWASVLWREAKILGAPDGLSLNRSTEAITVLQEAFDDIQEWTRNDAQSAWSRLGFISLGRELGELLRVRDPKRALSIYDLSLLRIREISDNSEARRGEAVLLAGSAYALRRLNRVAEARERIEAAFRVLAEAGKEPSDRAPQQAAVESVLRALADHLAETGQPGRAVQIYEDLVGRLAASNSDGRTDLRRAATVSQIYASLAALHRRGGLTARADALSAQRSALWRHWERSLPENAFIRHQLELAGAR